MSGYEDASGVTFKDESISLRNPVESVTWLEAERRMSQLGLVLPTEAQWERAARGGAETRYPDGNAPSAVIGTANFALIQDWELDEWDGPVAHNDGYRLHAPVGSYRANGYGLFDVLGNVWELCKDDYKVTYHARDHRAGDGLVLGRPDGDKSRRGGGFYASPLYCRITCRQTILEGDMNGVTGVRPARKLRIPGEFASHSSDLGRLEGQR